MRALIAAAGCCALICAPAPLSAQDPLLPGTSWGVIPTFSYFKFDTPVAVSNGALTSVQQIVVPLRFRALLRGQFTFDATGAFVTSSISVDSASESRSLRLSGLTDLRLRLTRPLFSGNALFTLGANVPTGKTSLSVDETNVLQAIGAPALQLPASALGLGASGTVGLSVAKEVGNWALALGGSVEKRSEYTAIELALSDGKALTKVAPGIVAHLTAGLDRLVGDRRLSGLIVVDHYAEDAISVEQSGGVSGDARYTLGTQITGSVGLAFAGNAWRAGRIAASVRHRGAFSDSAGAAIEGSNATYLDASWSGIRGRPAQRGLILGADYRYHTGMSTSTSLAAAAASAGGVTVGLEFPSLSRAFRIATHVEYGQFDTGVTKTNGFGVSLIASLVGQR